MSDDLIRASGLWVKDGKRGKFFSGQVKEDIPAGAKILIFRNDKRENESQPEFTLFFVSPEEQPPMRRAEPQTTRQAPEVDDSDIPF
jgi:hypothetical protein